MVASSATSPHCTLAAHVIWRLFSVLRKQIILSDCGRARDLLLGWGVPEGPLVHPDAERVQPARIARLANQRLRRWRGNWREARPNPAFLVLCGAVSLWVHGDAS